MYYYVSPSPVETGWKEERGLEKEEERETKWRKRRRGRRSSYRTAVGGGGEAGAEGGGDRTNTCTTIKVTSGGKEKIQ